MLIARPRLSAFALQRYARLYVAYSVDQRAGPASSSEVHSMSDTGSSLASQPRASSPEDSTIADNGGSHNARNLTGAAKLLADAIEEEGPRASSSREHLIHTQGPIWTGDESQPDAVLRMLVDAHKPLRSGEGIKTTASEDKIKRWMKELDLSPRAGQFVKAPAVAENDVALAESSSSAQETVNPHRTTIPPHLHRPWHSTYTGTAKTEAEPKIKFGMFIRKRADGDALTNLLELQLPPGADAKTRARVREQRRRGQLVGRVERAKDGALDYRLDIHDGEATETFEGNRQIKGRSVLGAGKGSASGLRAWAGLVEDRIQRARDSGYLKVTQGRGKPIPRDPNADNPHLETGELLMNRIVKRQGALPPWIELQNNLDNALNAFRSTLLTTYTTHLTRQVLSNHSLHPLPPSHAIPSRDDAWEARELKFHQENVKQINDLVRRLNTMAPAPARRHLVTLEAELGRVRGETLRNEVWEGIKRRAEQVKFEPATAKSPTWTLEDGFKRLTEWTGNLGPAASPTMSTVGKGGSSGISGSDDDRGGGGGNMGSTAEDDHGRSGQHHFGRRRLLFAVGAGAVVLAYFRPALRNDSGVYEIIPIREELPPPIETFINSPSESRFSPLQFLRLYILEPILTFFRFLHLGFLFAPVILTAPMLLVGKPGKRNRPGKPVAENQENWGAIWWYGLLVKQMERAGPSFIKLGQWAASRADLFPSALCEKMSKLHSSNKPHSFPYTRRVIERAFGLAFDDIFEVFETDPIGCGAIAQVYRAQLKTAVHAPISQALDVALGTSVAIKVLHPRVRKTVRRDIAIMMMFAKMIDALPGMHWISVPEEVTAFGQMMNSQLDLRVEASNLERFHSNFSKRGRMLTFPRPIKLGMASNGEARKESRDVLMEEYEDALPLKYFLRNGGAEYDDKIANIGLDAFLEMLLLDNFTHGDLHPGNIMVRFYKPTTTDYFSPFLSRFSNFVADHPIPPEQEVPVEQLVHSLSSIAHDPERWQDQLRQLNQKGYEPQLVFIDAGLITSLDAQNRKNFLELFQAVAEFDGYKAGKLMVERCRSPEYVIDEETFALKIQHLVLSVKSKTFSLAKIKISDILADVLTAVRQHHVKLEGDFVNTVISILLLEGIGRQLDPDMDLFKSALPILRQLGRQMGTREVINATPKGNLWAMAKLWVWLEARQVAGQASTIDEWIKYDRLSPDI